LTIGKLRTGLLHLAYCLLIKKKNLKAMKFFQRFGLDNFLLCLIGVIVLAYFVPQPGLMQEPVSLDTIANCGLTLVFFLYGLKLNISTLRSDLSNWRLHAVVQVSTFLFFPLLIILIKPLFPASYDVLWLGIFFLAALPSTVSSSVVMVSIARGNIPSAIFNASFSSLAGVFITPVWMSLFLSSNGNELDMSSIIIKLLLQVLLPVVLGLIMNKYWGNFATKHKDKLKLFDQSIILLIVYASFCHSFAEHAFEQYDLLSIALLAAGMVLLFFIAYGLITLVCHYLKFNLADTITATFCGSKKSLVHGTVMSSVLFAGSISTGIILLPLMMYHALQLLIVSALAHRLARKSSV
jgi:solute carrier family 10 (sodium/bile acid cotransporter), member 7